MSEITSAQQDSQLFKPPFEVAPPSVVESMTRAEVDMQITTAKRYPRDYSVVKRKMLSLATLDEETAESCFYVLNRQGKDIRGPSVRLAEIAASCFGNMRAAAQVVDNDGKTITARGICHDLESNSCFAVEVKRRITGRDGKTYNEDMQVVTGNAACSIALRNAIFKTVPFALIKPVYEQARAVAVGDVKTLVERRTRMLKAFAALGVNEARVLASLGKAGLEDIGLSELETLIGTHTAIKDGDQTVEAAFPAVVEKAVFQQAITPATGQQNTPEPKKAVATTTQPTKPKAVAIEKQRAAPKEENPAPKVEQPKQAPVEVAAEDKPSWEEPAAEQPKEINVADLTDEQLPDRMIELCKAQGITPEELHGWAVRARMIEPREDLSAMTPPKQRRVLTGWNEVVTQITEARK